MTTAARKVCLLLMVALAIPTLAAPRSVLIEANRIHLDQSRKQMVYSGSVRLRRDGLVIQGGHAIAKTSATGAQEVIITGNPVRAGFTARTGERIELTSRRLGYESGNELIRASGKVVLTAPDGVIRGERVEYSLTTDRFSVYGDDGQSRVSAIFPVTRVQPATGKP